jgi:uncharacterized cupin superfamily protein
VREIVNLFDAPRAADKGEPAGYGAPSAPVGPLVGASALGLTVYELPEGTSICPYHYEYPCEEWLIVLEGRPVLRDPDGEHDLEPGDVVCFPPGPEGAHKITNPRSERSLVAMLSTKDDPAVAVYPDSDKLGIFSSTGHHLFPRSAAVDYWHGET